MTRISILLLTLCLPVIAAAQDYAEDTSDCIVEGAQANPDPEALVTGYVRRDAAGEFLQPDPWFQSAVTCPEHENGADVSAVIRHYHIAKKSVDDKKAIYAVTYDIAGKLDYMKAFTAIPSTETLIFTALKTPFGWRLQSPVPIPHPSIETVLAIGCGQLPAADCARLDQLQ